MDKKIKLVANTEASKKNNPLHWTDWHQSGRTFLSEFDNRGIF